MFSLTFVSTSLQWSLMSHSVRQVFGCLLRTCWHNILHAHCHTRCVVLLGTRLYLSSRPPAHRLRRQVLTAVRSTGHWLFQHYEMENYRGTLHPSAERAISHLTRKELSSHHHQWFLKCVVENTCGWVAHSTTQSDERNAGSTFQVMLLLWFFANPSGEPEPVGCIV